MFGYPKWRAWTVIIVSLLGIFFSIPNFMSTEYYKTHVSKKMQEWWHPMTLGLDLQGGSNLLLEIQTDALINDRLAALGDSARSVLRENSIKFSSPKVEDGKLRIKILDASKMPVASDLIVKQESEKMSVESADNELIITYTNDALDRIKAEAATKAIEIVRLRIDDLGTKEPSIQRQGMDQISVQLPGVQNPNEVEALLGKTAKMTFHLVDESVSAADASRGKLPVDSMLLSGDDVEPLVVKRAPVVGGNQLDTAKPNYDETGAVVVWFSFRPDGAKSFARATRENIGRRLAIVLDGKIISAPVIRDAITKGQGTISGNFTMESASELALMLRSGALPAPLTVVEKRTVGAGLGSDSIQKGAWACVIGAGLVFLFMLLFYGWFGMFANVALVINVCLIFAVLSALGATLTLPGLAGIALTIGMAVDSNVLIYARMRDEIKSGHTVPLQVIDAGFNGSFAAIVDSQITTLFAAIVLFFMGAGPIKGFSITLGVGVFTSLFTAIMITKFLILIWYSVFKPKKINLKV
ncbi:MAG: protein translocase subunit SecD [Alphaproteobacteria bacterium]